MGGSSSEQGHEESNVKIELFRPEDAEAVGDLFRSVYGEDYPVKVYYDPEQLRKAFAEEKILPAVARELNTGRVVGITSLYNSAPWDGVYESGGGMVEPEFRQGRIFYDLCEYLYNQVAPKRNVALVFGEPVCIHVYSQRMQYHLGFHGMALEVDLMPRETYEVTFGSQRVPPGRVACMIDVKTFRPRPHRVYLPLVYEQQLRGLYARLDDERSIDQATAAIPPDATTRVETQFFESAGVVRMALHEAGRDVAEQVAREVEKYQGQGAKIFQAWVGLDRPWVGEVVEQLRDMGFFFGGLLPRWFDHDGILMQLMYHEPNWEGIKLYRPEMRELLQQVKADWQEVAVNLS